MLLFSRTTGIPYVPSIGIGQSGLGGCIRGKVWNVKFRLNYRSTQIFDYHYAMWRKNGKLCVGYYESVKETTACSCSDKFPTVRQVRESIAIALAAVGI